MIALLHAISHTAILWAAFFMLGMLFVSVARSFKEAEDVWGDLFAEYASGPHQLSRYILFFGTLLLAVRFLMAVVGASAADIESRVNKAMQVYQWLDIETIAGGSGAAYLMSKVTAGQILTLFGRKG
jgi:hypothetical protein